MTVNHLVLKAINSGGFFIIFDLAMGGNYPDGVCGTTTPTAATTSGASMSVGYVAVYEQGGNSTPAGTATATGTVTGINGLCLANHNSLNTSGNPIGVAGCNGSTGQQWSPYSDGTLRTQGGCLDVVSAGTSSAFSDPQWLEVNLGTSQAICQVTLTGEAAYATAFQIQVSTDGTTWTTIYSTTSGTGGTQTLNASGTGRYVRMYGTARATQYGYSLREFQVF